VINPDDPHAGHQAFVAGEPVASASAAVLALHGRGAGPEDIVELARVVSGPGFALVAPRAAMNTWYPYSFLEPFERNQPWLDSALKAASENLDRILAAGVPAERVVVLGFSQGGCLGLEFAARNARRYGALIGFSAGLIGPDGTDRSYPGSLAGTPVLLGCSDVDPHIPRARVEETAEVLRRLGGVVTLRLYPGMGHLVNQEEVALAREMVAPLASAHRGTAG
jgi:predicted esterase